MSRLTTLGVLFTLTAAAPALAGDPPPPPRGPLSVFVQARPDEAERSESEKSALKSKSEAAWKSVKDLEKGLKKQFGKDRAKWPEDQRRSYYDALDAAGVAWSESYYYARPAKEKEDSIKDFNKYLAKDKKGKYVTLAATRDEADLVIEIMGRKGMAKFVTGSKYLGFDLLPGKVAADALLGLPREPFEPWFEDHFWTLHWPKTGEVYFRFEANDTERWQDVAEYGVMTVDEVAKAYYDKLKPAQ